MRTTVLSLFAIVAILMTGIIPGQQLIFADSDELEVKIEIQHGMAEIKVELDDDEYEFKLSTSDIDEILEITSLRTGISIELLEDAMDLKVKHEDGERHDDDHDDERENDDDSNDSETDDMEKKLRAYTLGDSSEVKIKLEFVTDITDSDLLIDEILENFLVTKNEAEDILKIQEKDDDDKLEEKFKVEIEMEDNFSEVEVELRYILDSTNRDDIISSIIEHSQLDIDLLEDALEIQMESDDDTTDDTELKQLRVENNELRHENQELREKNNDLQEQLANLNNILMEQIRVIIDTLADLKS